MREWIRSAAFIARADLWFMLRQRETLLWVFAMPLLFFYFIGTVTGGFGGGARDPRDPLALQTRAADGVVLEAIIHRLEQMNFRDLPAGTVFAELATGHARPLDVWGEDDRQLADVYFERRGAQLRLKRAVTPSMLTVDERAIRQDCLCYFMERLEPRQAR